MPIFLCRLTCRDIEFRINKINLLSSLGLSSAAENLFLHNSNLLANTFPTTPCQLNWQCASLNELKTEWLAAAGTYFNSKIKHKKFFKCFLF